ncbi:hypothetical protein ACFO4E_15890 [Nocardiopsis mangrovi]|uniref:Uncharacterized protein n=1 Tax=Nocardiopsis mangrovi TaxID=1179818 RepID=A0ABV9DX34_9ACTN
MVEDYERLRGAEELREAERLPADIRADRIRTLSAEEAAQELDL